MHVNDQALVEQQRNEPKDWRTVPMADEHITEIAAVAWDKTKAKEDPAFADCIGEHRSKLVSHAKAVEQSGVAETDFEKKVAELLAVDAKKAEKAEPAKAGKK